MHFWRVNAAVKAGEVLFDKRPRYFARPVGSKVIENDRIAVGYGGYRRLSRCIDDNRRLDKLIDNTLIIRLLNGLPCVECGLARGVSHHIVRPLNALPAVIPV